LVLASILQGLGALLILFLLVAWWVSRSSRVTASMVLCLLAVPVLVLGLFGHLGLPLDVITSPAANVAIALGIDSMIHLVMTVRRRRQAGDNSIQAWARARSQMGSPILGAMFILATGFGIFTLSSFPPTQRFGMAVALGTLVAASMTLWVLPALAARLEPSA
jgi:predicted RND superfamily exporter protein